MASQILPKLAMCNIWTINVVRELPVYSYLDKYMLLMGFKQSKLVRHSKERLRPCTLPFHGSPKQSTLYETNPSNANLRHPLPFFSFDNTTVIETIFIRKKRCRLTVPLFSGHVQHLEQDHCPKLAPSSLLHHGINEKWYLDNLCFFEHWSHLQTSRSYRIVLNHYKGSMHSIHWFTSKWI